MAFVQPNSFQLTGRGITVSYSTTSIDGKPRLTYRSMMQSLTFSGDEIDVQDTPLGTLVSVRIMMTVDSGSTTFSLLIPRCNLNPGESLTIRTRGITAVHRFSVLPQFNHGQLDTYTGVILRGTAQLVQS